MSSSLVIDENMLALFDSYIHFDVYANVSIYITLMIRHILSNHLFCRMHYIA